MEELLVRRVTLSLDFPTHPLEEALGVRVDDKRGFLGTVQDYVVRGLLADAPNGEQLATHLINGKSEKALQFAVMTFDYEGCELFELACLRFVVAGGSYQDMHLLIWGVQNRLKRPNVGVSKVDQSSFGVGPSDVLDQYRADYELEGTAVDRRPPISRAVGVVEGGEEPLDVLFCRLGRFARARVGPRVAEVINNLRWRAHQTYEDTT